MREIELGIPASKEVNEAFLAQRASKIIGIKPSEIKEIKILKRSLDARGPKILYRYRFQVGLDGEEPVEHYRNAELKDVKDPSLCVIIVGMGPAGLYAAMTLLEKGIKPIILERGKDVHSRAVDMALLSTSGVVNEDSNYCFGEGGAGTFSDGKLFTRSTKKGDIRRILYRFVEFGASESILIDAHPHIGSDKLPRIIENMRNAIIAHGGEVHFEHRVTDIIKGEGNWGVKVDVVNTGETKVFTAPYLVLAQGHSSSDIYNLFYDKGWEIEAKGFALGVRAEHPQSLINDIQYKGRFNPTLPPAEYQLVTQANGRGVFSFCMCPGGILVPSATKPGTQVLNGMSNSRRNSPWANSGIVVSIEPGDIPSYNNYGPLQLLKFQEDVEKSMFDVSNSIKAPAQRLMDFVNGKISRDLPKSSYHPGCVSAPLHKILPEHVSSRMRRAFKDFNNKMRGYATNEALLLGVESRTSSPVRIPRNPETMEHVSLSGLYPCGEGAGYSGGIVSSALDGVAVAERIALKANFIA